MNSTLLDNYVTGTKPAHRMALHLLHDTIVATIPEAEIVIRRGVPAFRYRNRPLVSIGDTRHKVSLYIMQGSTIARHAQALNSFDASRTVVRFDPKHIPTELVAQLVRARAAEIDEMVRTRTRTPSR